MPGRRIAILEEMKSGKGILGKESGKGPLGLGIIPGIQERANKILKR